MATGKDRVRDPEVFETAERLTRGRRRRAHRSLRRPKVSPGVKFKDSELIGVPTIVVVGKSLENGVIEIKDRRPVTDEVPVADAVTEIPAEVN